MPGASYTQVVPSSISGSSWSSVPLGLHRVSWPKFASLFQILTVRPDPLFVQFRAAQPSLSNYKCCQIRKIAVLRASVAANLRRDAYSLRFGLLIPQNRKLSGCLLTPFSRLFVSVPACRSIVNVESPGVSLRVGVGAHSVFNTQRTGVRGTFPI